MTAAAQSTQHQCPRERYARSSRPPLLGVADAVFLSGFGALAAAAVAGGRLLHPAVQAAGLALAAVETLFWAWRKLRLHQFSVPLPGDDLPCTGRQEQIYDRFLQLADVFDIREFLSGWFHGTPAHAIPRGNVEEFVTYGFYFRTPAELTAEQRQSIRAFLDRLEQRAGVTFSPGYDPSLRYMAHLWEPLRVAHKPFLAYLGAEAMARAAHALLWLMGFRRQRQAGFCCWVAPPRCATAAAAVDSSGNATGEAGNDLLAPAPSWTRRLAARHGSFSRGGRVEEAVHHAAEAVHHAAEAACCRALEDALTAVSSSSAAVAAQHPHAVHPPNQPHPLPRAACWPPEAAVPGALQIILPAGYRKNPVDAGASGSEPGTVEDAIPGGAETAIPGARVPAAGPTRFDVPIIFLHGVGVGVLPYLHLVREIMKALPASPVAVVEVPHVALRLCWQAREVDEVAAAVASLLRARGWSQACLVAHSYGTFVASRFCQMYPQMVHSLCAIDPVTMMTCYPQLLSNFIYQPSGIPRSLEEERAGGRRDGVLDLVRFIVSRDLFIAQAFCRLFHWTELILWPEDTPASSLIVLSGQDDLVPSELVMSHFKVAGHSAKVMFHPDLGHGGLLMDMAWQDEMITHLRRMLLAAPARKAVTPAQENGHIALHARASAAGHQAAKARATPL